MALRLFLSPSREWRACHRVHLIVKMGFFGKSAKELLALAMSTGGALLLCTLLVRAVVRAGPGTEVLLAQAATKAAAEAVTVEVEAAAAAEAVPTSHVKEIVAGKLSKALKAALEDEDEEEEEAKEEELEAEEMVLVVEAVVEVEAKMEAAVAAEEEEQRQEVVEKEEEADKEMEKEMEIVVVEVEVAAEAEAEEEDGVSLNVVAAPPLTVSLTEPLPPHARASPPYSCDALRADCCARRRRRLFARRRRRATSPPSPASWRRG